MSAQLTTFRKYVAGKLEPALGVTFVHGKIDSGVERKRVACIFPDATQEHPEDVNQGLLTVIVRVFLPLKTTRSTTQPAHDPEKLEEVAEKIQTTWRGEVHGGGVWFSRVVGVEFDLDANMIEATLLATAGNPAVVETP